MQCKKAFWRTLFWHEGELQWENLGFFLFHERLAQALTKHQTKPPNMPVPQPEWGIRVCRQDWIHNTRTQLPQGDDAGPLVKELVRISRWRQQGIKPSTEPSVTARGLTPMQLAQRQHQLPRTAKLLDTHSDKKALWIGVEACIFHFIRNSHRGHLHRDKSCYVSETQACSHLWPAWLQRWAVTREEVKPVQTPGCLPRQRQPPAAPLIWGLGCCLALSAGDISAAIHSLSSCEPRKCFWGQQAPVSKDSGPPDKQHAREGSRRLAPLKKVSRQLFHVM